MKKILIRLVFLLILSNIIYSANMEISLFEPGTKLMGVNSVVKNYFYLEDNIEIQKDLKIDILIFFSELTNPKNSSLTFFINERPLNSVKLVKDGDNKVSGILSVPREYIKKGMNEFLVGKTQILTDDCNIDEINLGNWIRIERSVLNYEYIENNEKITLENFPVPFVNRYRTNAPQNLNILMNKVPSDDEKLLLANLSGLIGTKKINDLVKVRVDNIEKILLKEKLDKNYIIISEFDTLPESIKKQYSIKEKELMQENLSFKLIRNYNESDKLLLVISKKGKNFSRNFGSLFYTNGDKELTGEFSAIADVDERRVKPTNSDFMKISLEEIGVSDINLSSGSERKGSFILLVTRDREIVDDVIFNIKISKSELLKDEELILHLRVNDSYILGIDVKEKNTGEYSVKIPVSALKEGENFIEFEGDFSKKHGCDIQPQTVLTIKKESNFIINSKEKDVFNLRDFRAPFVKNRRYNNLGISVSNDKESLSFLGDLFILLSRNINNYDEIYYLNKNDESKNQIIIGNNETNNLISEKWDKLFLPYKDSKTPEFKSTGDINILEESIYSAIEFLKTGENSYSLYIFTDREKEYENILNQFKKREFRGNAYVGVNLDTSIYKKTEIDTPKIIKRFRGRTSKLAGIFFLVFSFFSLLILYFINKKSDR